MTEIQPELLTRLMAVARAIDGVLIAEHGPRYRLKAPLPWDASLADGVKHYGEGPLFELWSLCRSIEALRIAWTGKPGSAVEAAATPVIPPVDEPKGETPDELVGPDEAVGSAEPKADARRRLVPDGGSGLPADSSRTPTPTETISAGSASYGQVAL